MISRLNYYHFWLRLWCYSLPTCTYGFSWYVRFHLLAPNVLSHIHMAQYISALLLTSLVWVIAAEQSGVCRVEELFLERTGVRAASRAWFTTYALLLCSLFFLKLDEISRGFLGIQAIALLGGTLVVHAALRLIIRRRRERSRHSKRVLVVGADAFARRAAMRLRHTPICDCSIVGFVQLPDQEIKVCGAPVYQLGDLRDLEISIDDIVIAVPMERSDLISRIAQQLEPLCIPLRAIIDLGDTLVCDRIFHFGRLQMLDLTSTPADTPAYKFAKRIFDLLFCTIAIVVASPVMAVCAVATKVSSPGPVIFKQKRVGLNGKLFTMYKFRTMRVAPPTESDVGWTTADDPRCTRVGEILRRASLDELPQFFNVLKGDMSVVGPRPERPHFAKKFAADYARYSSRHRLKVGITGWAQVNGLRGDTPIRKRVQYDLYYLNNWSFWFDMQIVIQTVWAALIHKNAY